jgi:hypothetical protein
MPDRQNNRALHVTVGCPRHRRDGPNVVLVLRRDIIGALRPRSLPVVHFFLCYLLDQWPVVMPHQAINVPLVTSALVACRAADQKETDREGKNRCVSSFHSAMARPNEQVSDGTQPPMRLNLSLGESAGSRSLARLVRCSFFVQASHQNGRATPTEDERARNTSTHG